MPGLGRLRSVRVKGVSCRRSRKSAVVCTSIGAFSARSNRAGKKLPAARKKVLEAAKDELRVAFGRDKEN
ncbi:DUF3175 domain-containing protein [Mesorhizobium loti]|uniref:DUF3175 domain-containing protein n=1 Tax=Mesorhizobium loti R88b TaxID=935548 RepID=A0A6M7WQG5_RHILI|nr:DUF3175 domain-containing protein [Mesorhizobium loti R88b]